MLHETGRRNLALLRLKYGVFNSPAPTILHRIGHSAESQSRPTVDERKYGPGDYFHLTLKSEIAEGASGKVHDAKIEVQASESSKSHLGIVSIRDCVMSMPYIDTWRSRKSIASPLYMASLKMQRMKLLFSP